MSELTAIDNSIISIGNSLVQVVPSTPVDPYNPLGLPPFTIRVKFSTGYTPTMGDSQTLVDSTENVWDITQNSTNWTLLFAGNSNISRIIGSNTTGVTNMSGMFTLCSELEEIQLFDTRSVTNMSSMFSNCYNVQSGALALYQQVSTQATVPTHNENTFYQCGASTTTGAAELAQIPSSWGGTGS